MVKLCAVKTCPSSRKITKKKDLSFFQPTTPAKLENWRKSLGFDLRKTDYVCHLHFREQHVRMYDKVNIQGTMYYSYLHKKVLKEEALPTIDHQFQPPPQGSITTQTKVKELLLKKQPCNNFVKNTKKVNLQNQVQIETSLKDDHQSTASPGLLEERQADDCSMNDIKPQDSFQDQIENQLEKSNLHNQREGKDQQQTLQLELATPRLVPYSNIGLQGLLVQQPDNNCTMYYIKTDGNFGMQIENQFSQSDLQQLSGGKEHQGTQIVQLATPKQETYSINYIKIENTLQEQTKNQFAQNNLEEQRAGTECQQTQQIQLAIPKQVPHCNIELQGLSVDQQSNNYSVNYIKTQESLLEQTENKCAQNDLKEQWKTMENQQTQQIQLSTSKQEPHYSIEIKMLSVDQQSNSFSVKDKQTDGSFHDQTDNKFAQINLDEQRKAMKNEQTPEIQLATPDPEPHCNIELHRQANNHSMDYIKTGESFQEKIENKFVHNNLENLRVEDVQQQTQKLNQSFVCWKNKFTKLSVLPPYWLYLEKSEGLEFMRIDPTNMQVKNHLRLNDDLSITVIFLTKEEFLTKDIVSVNNFKSYLKSVEQWPICVGTQIKQKYSKKCKGVIIGDENHNSHKKDLRCKSCRILRNQLQRSLLK